MMIGAESNTPSDWVRAGNAIVTVDRFAALHRRNAPVLVFTDTGGAFDVDTECVNRSRGNAAGSLDQRRGAIHHLELRCERGSTAVRRGRLFGWRHLCRGSGGHAP
jgi:hypothetical protein